MAKTKRVHNIAKELGVDSKAILAKCQAEGVPDIVNHMSVVKVGLEQTIREWFSDAKSSTAVETAAPVDLEKVRRPARRKARKADEADQDQTATAVAAPAEQAPEAKTEPQQVEEKAPVDEPAVTPAEPSVKADTAGEPTATAATPAAQPQAGAEPSQDIAASAAPAVSAEAPAEQAPAKPQEETRAKVIQPAGRVNVPDRPKIVKPAGQQLTKPQQAVLRGPKVVRIEQPEIIEPRRPKRPAAPGSGPARGPIDMPGGITRSKGPARGRGVGGPAPLDEPTRGGKRRTFNIRRGRTADAQLTGPTNLSEQDLIELDARLKGAPGFLKKHRRDMKKQGTKGFTPQTAAVTGGVVQIAEPITIKALSAATGIKSSDIIKYLFKKGIMATINSAIDAEAAMEICLEYNIELEVKEQQSAEQLLLTEFEQRERQDVRPRPPVVTVLGHVDHGKTSLLDRIRRSDVAAHEAGGITQHVGAYRVTIKGTDGKDKTVVFLDTPGHEAFTSMRARGASMTDLVVLVVAADDGVMPQTIESINHAKAANVPIIVALNKIDRPEATQENIRKIYGQLAEHGLNPVEWGGDTEVVKVSALRGDGITDLMEILDYQAELLQLTAGYGGPARGVVIEGEMQEGRGPVARVLIQEGTLHVGDFIVAGRAFGRVRDMTDDRGQALREAGPATPLELSGLDVVPDAGDKFYVAPTLKRAEEIALQYREAERQRQLASKTKVTLDNFAQIASGETKELRIVLKADVQGSIDVLRKSLTELGNEEVSVKVLHAGVGAITESDVLLADASDAVIIGFHVVAPAIVREIAEQRDVDIRLYRIIYDVTDEVKKALEGLLEPETKEQQVGVAEVREVFKVSKVGTVAGCLVTEGSAQRSAKVRVVRDGVVITENRDVASLRRVKEDVNQVRAGTECGIKLQGFDDVKIGDQLVFYNKVQVKRTLG